jgi:hypothetical protein
MLRVANPLRPMAPSMFKGGDKGSAAFGAFQKEIARLLDELQALPELPEDDTDIGSQVRVCVCVGGGVWCLLVLTNTPGGC